jgi:hypothetical protein
VLDVETRLAGEGLADSCGRLFARKAKAGERRKDFGGSLEWLRFGRLRLRSTRTGRPHLGANLRLDVRLAEDLPGIFQIVSAAEET